MAYRREHYLELLRTSSRHFPPTFHRDEWSVQPISHAAARVLIEAHHYAKGCANTSVHRHGLFHQDDPLPAGAILYMPPIRSAALRAAGERWREVLSLSRLAIHPAVPTNAASFLISRSARLIRQTDSRWSILLTYADEGEGHTGTIYRAANWTEDGHARYRVRWTDPSGRIVSRKVKDRTRSPEEMRALGYLPSGGGRKIRFILRLRS